MPINLTKGANVSLSNSVPGLTNILIGLGWDARATDGDDFDLDTDIDEQFADDGRAGWWFAREIFTIDQIESGKIGTVAEPYHRFHNVREGTAGLEKRCLDIVEYGAGLLLDCSFGHDIAIFERNLSREEDEVAGTDGAG